MLFSNSPIAKAWSLDDMNRHIANLKAVDYGEMQSTTSCYKATTGYERLWFPLQQIYVKPGNLEVSLVFEDQDLEWGGTTPYGRQGETFRDSNLRLSF